MLNVVFDKYFSIAYNGNVIFFTVPQICLNISNWAKIHNFQGLARYDNDFFKHFLIGFFSLHWASPLKMTQSQNMWYESEKNDTKTGITQVLIQLQQKILTFS